MPRTADEIIIERAERDLDEGVAHQSRLLRESHPILGRAMEAGVNGALHAISLQKRYRADLEFLLGLAHRAAAGEDPAALVDANLARLLRTKELALIAREKDPAFGVVVKRCRDFAVKRLPDLARMATVPEPRDYDDVVRRAFASQSYVEAMVEDNRVFVLDLLDYIHQHPNLLRVPNSWIGKLDRVSREMVAWQAERVLRGVREIYATPPAAAGPA